MASCSRGQNISPEEVLEMVMDDEATMGMTEDEEYELDRQLGYYSDESR